MKFGVLFEYHKIPEWYTDYFRYNEFVKEIELFQSKRYRQDIGRLPGIFYLALAKKCNHSISGYESQIQQGLEDCLIVPIPILTSGWTEVEKALKIWLKQRSDADDLLDEDESNEDMIKEQKEHQEI